MSLVASTRSETTKVFTTSAWWVLAIVLVLYVGGLAGGMGALFTAITTGQLGADGSAPPVSEEALPATLYTIATSIGYVFPLLVGTLMSTGEFRHKTLTPTFLATPRRGVALSGKVLVAVLVGLIYGVISLVSAVVPAAAFMAAGGVDTQLTDSDMWALFGRALLALVLWTIIGVALGAAVRNQVAAIVIVLAFTQFVEPILRVAGAFLDWLEDITAYLPGAASDSLVGQSFYVGLGGGVGDNSLEWWVGGIVLGVYAIVLLILANLTSWRRDIT